MALDYIVLLYIYVPGGGPMGVRTWVCVSGIGFGIALVTMRALESIHYCLSLYL
jgi:hypothetical protein